MSNAVKVEVHLKYGQLEEKLVDEPQEAWLQINNFFKNALPTFELAKKLALNVNVQKIASELEGLVAFSAEGANLLVSKAKLTDNEALLVWLLAQFVGCELGMVEQASLSKDALQIKLGKSSKIVSTRLGELVKNNCVTRTVDDHFRISSFGVLQAQKEVIPKIRSKIKA
ncbi:MAG: hypothetical protein NWF01_07380 [Candidatus Bathyarchaeota archaeon]|nr:hypothetical protein [Candidatus Bathyarchaeota archaeon]